MAYFPGKNLAKSHGFFHFVMFFQMPIIWAMHMISRRFTGATRLKRCWQPVYNKGNCNPTVRTPLKLTFWEGNVTRTRCLRSDNGSVDIATITTRSNIAAGTTLLPCNISKHKIAFTALHAGTRYCQWRWHAVQTAQNQWQSVTEINILK